jgi:isoleucyl-tRNA synthetase
VEGRSFEVLPEDVEVKAQAKEGFAVAEEGAYVVALRTELTPDLVREGQAREFVRRVQELRKSANLDVADRIQLFVVAAADLKSAIETHRDYVSAETLATTIEFQEPPTEAAQLDEALDGQQLRVGIVKAALQG